MDLELRHLRAICVIADVGSITKAAAVLGVSQPALTAQLQRVEREIGGLIFVRDRRGVAVTPLGEYVLIRARGVLAAMDELRGALPQHSYRLGKALRLGGVAGPIAVGLADRLSGQLANVEVRLHTEYSPRVLWELLLAGRLDAAAIVDYPGFTLQLPSTVLGATVAVEPVFVALPESHQLTDRDEVDLADLADESWALTPPDGAGWPDCFYRACHHAGFTPRVLYTISGVTPIREVVAARHAVTPCQAVFEASNGVLVRPLAGTPIQMRHLLVCRRDAPLAGHFVDLVRLAQEVYAVYSSRRPDYQAWLRRHGHREGELASPALPGAVLAPSR